MNGKNCSQLAVDTEFERRTTFFAHLALVQIYDGQSIYLIDPLQVSCPDELRKVFADPKISIILHSCKEDLEVLYTAWQCKISALMDTQIAYQFAKGDVSIGYAKLVETLLGHQIDKQQTCSDWMKRPLTPEQLSYAAIDVVYLPEIANDLEQQLVDCNLQHLFQQECDELTVNAINRVEQMPDYREAKDVWRLTSSQLSLFKQLFEWRENIARNQNRTRNHIIRDHSMVALAQSEATNYEQLKLISDIHPRSLRLYACDWFDIIQQWQSTTAADNSPITPAAVLNPRDVKGFKPLSDRLEKSIKKIASENCLHPTLLMSKRLIRRLSFLMLTQSNWRSSLSGWRKELLTDEIGQCFEQFKAQNAV
ncbi:MAG: HRDC domain-containing protein [Enterobacterales bacterium]|nr:HRDC domain-containing protein [Enterobacterales bacterium]